AVGAALALARGLERVLVVDFDVHHGNGTQHTFEADPRVLYVSSHAYPFYPGTGAVGEVGTGPGEAFTGNLPFPSRLGDGESARAHGVVVAPIARAYDPGRVMGSAGFDAWGGDPLAPMTLTEKGYAELARVCLAAAEGAARGRAVFVLEGGYDLEGLALSGAAVARALLGETAPPLSPTGRPLDALVAGYRRVLGAHWPVLAG